MAKQLAHFNITKTGDGEYMLHIEDDSGDTLELAASFEQLDVIAEAIDEHLDEDSDDVEIVGDEDEE